MIANEYLLKMRRSIDQILDDQSQRYKKMHKWFCEKNLEGADKSYKICICGPRFFIQGDIIINFMAHNILW